MKPFRIARAAAAAAALAAMAGSPVPASADVASFYKDKTITIYIGYSAGGGYDAYARLVGRYIVNHIPGHPRAVAKNYTGAGGLRIMNALYNAFPQDGSVIGAVGRNIISQPLFDPKGVKFDGSKMKWLGSTNQEYSMCVFYHTSKFKTTEDLLTKSPAMGGLALGSSIDVFTLLVNNLLGGHIRLITGYPGGADINLAMERGELDGRCGWSWSSIQSTKPDWLKEDRIRMTLQHALKKHRDLQNIPLITDLVKTERDKKALMVHLSPQVYGRPYAVGPKVPDDRYVALRDAFWKTMHDPKFLADARKRKLPIDPTSGEEMDKLVKEIYALPKGLLAYAAEVGTVKDKSSVTKAVIPIATYEGKITGLKSGGRRVSWAQGGNKGRLRVSGGGTKITVAGKKAKRGALKIGMNCSFRVKGAETALNIDCK